MGLFGKLQAGLRKTHRLLNTDIRDLFKSEGRLVDDAFLDDLLAILVKTDIGVGPARRIIADVRTDCRGRVVQFAKVLATITQKVKDLLAS